MCVCSRSRARLATNVRCQRNNVVRLICVSASINSIGARACVCVWPHAAAAADSMQLGRSHRRRRRRAAWKCSTYARASVAAAPRCSNARCPYTEYPRIYLYCISRCAALHTRARPMGGRVFGPDSRVRVCARAQHSIFVRRDVLWRAKRIAIYYQTHTHTQIQIHVCY